jgi:hypothetical protein
MGEAPSCVPRPLPRQGSMPRRTHRHRRLEQLGRSWLTSRTTPPAYPPEARLAACASLPSRPGSHSRAAPLTLGESERQPAARWALAFAAEDLSEMSRPRDPDVAEGTVSFGTARGRKRSQSRCALSRRAGFRRTGRRVPHGGAAATDRELLRVLRARRRVRKVARRCRLRRRVMPAVRMA